MSQWARNNPEQSRRDAYAADLAIEEYYNRQAEEDQPPEEEEEPEPLVAGAQEVFC